MSNYIKPTFTLTSNASSATTDPGPLSVALSLSATPDDSGRLTVDELITAKTHTFASATDHFTIIDGSTEDIGSNEAGINGCFVFIYYSFEPIYRRNPFFFLKIISAYIHFFRS